MSLGQLLNKTFGTAKLKVGLVQIILAGVVIIFQIVEVIVSQNTASASEARLTIFVPGIWVSALTILAAALFIAGHNRRERCSTAGMGLLSGAIATYITNLVVSIPVIWLLFVFVYLNGYELSRVDGGQYREYGYGGDYRTLDAEELHLLRSVLITRLVMNLLMALIALVQFVLSLFFVVSLSRRVCCQSQSRDVLGN